MSVPGRIGIILIVALAIMDAAILVSGARQAESAIRTGSLIQETVPAYSAGHDTLIAAAIRQIGAMMPKPAIPEEPQGI